MQNRRCQARKPAKHSETRRILPIREKKKGATQAPFFISTLPAGLADLVIEGDARAFFATRQQAKKTFMARLGQHRGKKAASLGCGQSDREEMPAPRGHGASGRIQTGRETLRMYAAGGL